MFGAMQLFEGYGGDSPDKKAQGIKQLAAGIGVVALVPSIPSVINAGSPDAALAAIGGYLAQILTYMGGGLGVWGAANLLEGYGSDSSASKSQGLKQIGGGVGLIALGQAIPGAFTGGAQDAAIAALSTMMPIIGGGLGVWGAINLIEGYGADSPASKSQGLKQVGAGAAFITLGGAIGGMFGGDPLAAAGPALAQLLTIVAGGLGAWGAVNLIEGYGNDSPASKSQGLKQIAAGAACFGITGMAANLGGGDAIGAAAAAVPTLLQGIGGGLGAWGVVNLIEGYGNDSPASKSQGLKQLVAGIACFNIAAPASAAITGGTDFSGAAGAAVTAMLNTIGGGLGAWGVINLMEGYGNDSPASKSQGIKQLASGVACYMFAGAAGGLVSAGGDASAAIATSVEPLIRAIGGGLGAWGVINLMEGYGNDSPASKSQGAKQLAAGIACFAFAPTATSIMQQGNAQVAITAGIPTLITSIGAGLGVWGLANLMEGYGTDSPASKAQGIKQLMAGAAMVGASQIVANMMIP